MKNLDDVIERLLTLRGEMFAQRCITAALLQVLRSTDRMRLAAELDAEVEAARVVLLNGQISEVVVDSFEREILSLKAKMAASR